MNSERFSFFKELFKFGIIAFVVVFPIRIFIAQPFIVSGASMEPTFENGEYLIVDQLSYRLGEPERGDVVIFKYPRDHSKYFIKRIIGLPGETLTIIGEQILIKNSAHPDGFRLDEDAYVVKMNRDIPTEVTLGSGEYFVLGDNRDASSDSRTWGTLSREEIVGRAFVRLFPVTEFSVFPGKAAAQND